MARPAETDAATRRVLVELERHELLLQAGREFPSVANIVADEEIVGSWWAHSKSNLIYWVCEDLEQHPHVADARLIAGKVTHMWHTIWPHVAAIALARAPWQTRRLTLAARRLLVRVDVESVRTDTLEWTPSGEKLGDVCRGLERRLLLKAREVHAESGKHAKLLTSWRVWWDEHGSGPLPTVDDACARLENIVGDQRRLLPWWSVDRRSNLH